jgi:hypothetical protein
MKLTVETNLTGGNACLIGVEETENAAEIRLTPDPHGGPETMWFRFRARSAQPVPGGRLRLVVAHFGNLLGGGDPAFCSPVMCPAGGDWIRLGAGRLHALPDGQVEGVWDIDFPHAQAEFALCFPYGTAERDALATEHDGYWTRDVIGVSQQGRPLVRLSNGYGSERDGEKRPGIYTIARQHAGEMPGSWVLHGFLKAFAERRVDDILVWSVPLTNIDGVENGDYGKDNFPYDLNRAWGRPPMRHETLVLQRDMARWKARCNAHAAFDFHAPGLAEHGGIYAFLPPADAALAQQLDRWASVCGRAFGAFADATFARHATYASRWETPTFTRYCVDPLRLPALSFEVPYSFIGSQPLTRADYLRAGRQLADGVIAAIREAASGSPDGAHRTL